jgi:hypothetical protein
VSAGRLPRGRRSPTAALVALVVVVVCVLVAVAAIQLKAGHDHTVLGHVGAVAARLRTHGWHDVIVLVVGIVAAALGLVLLLTGLLPGRRALVAMTAPDEHTVAGIARGGLVRDLAAIGARVDGVASCRVRLGRAHVRAKVRSALRDRAGLRDAVRAALTDRLTELAPLRAYDVRVRVTDAKGAD